MTIYKAGTTTYDNTGTNIIVGSTSPTPPANFTSYDYNATAGQLAYRMWLLPGDAKWQFRHAMWIDTATATDLDFVVLRSGADAGNALIVRGQGTSKLRVVATGSTFPFTSTPSLPLSGWYLLQGYGDGVAGTARVALCDYATGTPVSGLDSTEIAVAQGGVGPGAVRFGKCSGSSAWAGKLAWTGTEVRTGTDAASTFIGPYTAPALAINPVLTPGDPRTVGNLLTLTLNPTGGNGNSISYSVTWDGTNMGPQSSNVFTKTDTTAGTKTISYTATQA
jgi:hypothetical protein